MTQLRCALLLVGDIDKYTGGYLYDRKIVEFLRRNNATVDIIQIRRLPFLQAVFAGLWLLNKLFGRTYHLLIEDELGHFSLGFLNGLLRRISKGKIVSLVHSLAFAELGCGISCFLHRFFELLMLRTSDAVIATSRHTARLLENMELKKRVAVIYPGRDAVCAEARSRNHRSGALRLLHVGSCIERKGLTVLLRSLTRIRDPRVQLDVVGDTEADPSYVRKVMNLIADLNLKNRVRLHGRISSNRLSQLYSSAYVFVLPSLYESHGVVISEAMNFGIPVVATKVGGIPDLVEDEANGLLVRPGDPDELYLALKRLLENPELTAFLGANALRRSKHLPIWEETGKMFLQHLIDVVSRDPN